MRETKKLTLSAIVCALNVVILAVGAGLETVDLTIAALTSFSIVFLCVEVRGVYPVGAWLVTSVLALIFFPAKPVWAEFLLLFGIYPILKDKIEKLSPPLRIASKLTFFLTSFSLLLWLFGAIFGIPVFGTEEDLSLFFMGLFPNLSYGAKLGILYALCMVCAVAYDYLINVTLRLYFWKWRDKIKNFLK